MALTDLDTRVALMAQVPQIDFNQLANNTLTMYDNMRQRGQQGLLSRLIAQNTGADGQVDLNKALQNIQSNPNQAYQPDMVNTLSGLIKQQKAAETKAQQDAEKFKTDNAKTVAETNEKLLGNTQKGQTLLSSLIATSTDATDAARKLTTFGQQYGLPQTLIDSTLNDLKTLAANNQGSPESFQKLQKSYGLLAADDPTKYLMPDANTVANNETSIANNKLTNQTSRDNNQATVNATLSGQQNQKQIADANREQDAEKTELKDIGGYQAIYYPQTGEYDFVRDSNGNPLKSQKSVETPIKKMERVEKAQNYASASSSAANGAKLAADIQTRYKALDYNPLRFAAESKIPGTQAYNINRDIETLKSNIFLAKTGDMRGLGALTEQEGARLVASMGSLDPLQGAQFLDNLGKIAQQFSSIAKSNRDKTKIYAGQDISRQEKPNSSPKTYSQSDVSAYAQQSGRSIEEVKNMILKSGGRIE
ncbi:hypothetical protein KTH73_04060 [Acinetobacter courvalinii]|uniref:hypothetical protein n=1 Tax=Acinetobacter courvalinii TaxID=280147 RepID=UPI0021CDE645|nr:hypothetical protein [Acinetobacter courvalinii]MCU4389901.1 hypothetical protein [Acinetobacter courvalinii]